MRMWKEKVSWLSGDSQRVVRRRESPGFLITDWPFIDAVYLRKTGSGDNVFSSPESGARPSGSVSSLLGFDCFNQATGFL